MKFDKICLMLYFLIYPVLCIFSQASVTISDYGVYYIDNETIKKIPTNNIEISGAISWRNYIILDSSTMRFFYNVENGAVSDHLYPTGAMYYFPSEKKGFFPLRNNINSNLLFYHSGTEFELDPVTLRTIRSHVWSRNDNVYDLHPYLRDQNGNLILWHFEEREYKYTNNGHGYRLYFNETEYVDIQLTQNIDYYKDTAIICMSNSNKQLVFIINDTNHGGR